MVVILDSGHNEKTPGKESQDGTLKEYLYTHNLVEAVRTELISKSGYMPMHLDPDKRRNGATDSNELNFRVALANSIEEAVRRHTGEKVILVSVHLDASSNKDARGATVYIAPNCSQNSKKMASIFAENINVFGLKGNRCEQIKTGNFAIIRDTKMPAVLLECAYMTNGQDKDFLETYFGFQILKSWIVSTIEEIVKRNLLK